MLTCGELFAGIGGIGLGFERAGMRTLWQVEFDPFCRSVLSEQFPEAQQYADVRDCTGDPRRWADEGGTLLEYVDVLAGGFPCQPISHNGHGLVEGDERWLWPEFARLVGELRPRYVVVENVAAITSGRGFSEVLGDLAALRYDAEWSCIRASDAEAPHRRERLFLVAYSERIGRQAGPRVFTDVALEDLPQPTTWRGVPHRDADGRVRLHPPSDVVRVADGVSTELDLARLKAVGNAVVPQLSEWIGRRIIACEQEEAVAA